MFQIYSRYRSESDSFINSVKLLQELLMERLSPEYSKIWIQGYASDKVQLSFTAFKSGGGAKYTVRNAQVTSFRLFRHNGDIQEEIKLMEKLINKLRVDVLEGII